MRQLNLKGKKVLILGLGLLGGGVATVLFLLKKGARVTITDLKTKEELAPSLNKLKGKKVTYILGRHRMKDIQNNEIIIRNPSVPKNSPYIRAAQKQNKIIENDASLFFRFCHWPIIAVTGSKGKSTTVLLIKKIFDQACKKPILVGHNTVPVLSQLKYLAGKRPVIFEMSSWRLERLAAIKQSPRVAVITNVFRDHLNKYRNFNEYLADKKNIFCWQNKTDFVILNRDNQITRKIGQEAVAQRFWFSLKYFPQENGIFIRANKIIYRWQGKQIVISDLKEHHWSKYFLLENILPAILVAKISHIKNRDIVLALDRLRASLPGRLETIATVRGVTFINDTCATVPEATLRALDRFSRPPILIAGGEDKKLDYTEFSKRLPVKTKSVHFFDGSATKKMIRRLNKKKCKYTLSPNLVKAFKQAIFSAQKGDTIILSPAAASFGKYFVNEFDRGEQFNKLVKSFY